MLLERWKMTGADDAPRSDNPDAQFVIASLGHGLVLCNRYGLPMAARSLGEFQGASEAPVSHVILVERATRKFAQRTAARRVELKMGLRLRCFSVTGRKEHAPSSRLGAGHFELNHRQ